MEKRVKVIVSGRVQGVGFRYHTLREALRNNVSGWVRNRQDGSVEAVFQGDPVSVDEMLDFVRRGPSHAEVFKVDVREEPPADEGSEFNIR